MTHILQATHDAWIVNDPGASGNLDATGVFSPILTVPYNAASLFMDVTLYDQAITRPAHPAEQIQFYLKSVNEANPGNMGSTNYQFESNFYGAHAPGATELNTFLGIELKKNGGPWVIGDTFVMLWLFYQTDHSVISGIKSIRIY